MPPRLYSIASSLNAHPDEVHLTVATSATRSAVAAQRRLLHLPRDRWEGDTTAGALRPVPAKANFFLPPDKTVADHTWLARAPCRPPAFLEERQVSGATGKNWLVFGEQRALGGISL